MAHAKRVKKSDYDEATRLIDELKSAFNSCLEHIDGVKMTEDEAEAVQKVAKETMTLYPSMRTFPGKNLYPGMVSALETLNPELKVAIPPDGVASIAQTLASLPQNFPDNSLLVAPQLASTFQSPAFEALESWQRTMDMYGAALEPMQRAVDVIQRAMEPQRGL